MHISLHLCPPPPPLPLRAVAHAELCSMGLKEQEEAQAGIGGMSLLAHQVRRPRGLCAARRVQRRLSRRRPPPPPPPSAYSSAPPDPAPHLKHPPTRSLTHSFTRRRRLHSRLRGAAAPTTASSSTTSRCGSRSRARRASGHRASSRRPSPCRSVRLQQCGGGGVGGEVWGQPSLCRSVFRSVGPPLTAHAAHTSI